MKKIKLSFVLIFMFFQTLKVISQDYIPFPSDSASWNITTYLFGDCNPLMGDNCQYTDKFIVKGDTMIDNEKYTKLYLVSGTTIDNLTYLGGFREDSTKKVFYRGDIFFDSYVCDSMINDTTEILLYDFGLSIGDSIKNINFKCAKELVYDIDSVEYAGKKRKRFTIQRYGAINDNYWIEGVGSTKGLFYPLLNWFEWDWELTCFEDNIQDWSASECVTTGIENINTSINAFNIYPNPMIYESIIEWDENILNPDLIVVYSIMGKKILSIKPVTNSIILKKSTFVNSGLYIVNLITDKENIIKRLIVE